jgi:hypothetical protein
MAMIAGPKEQKPKAAPDPREARLARALRENLRRRKAKAGEVAPVSDADDGAL